jgi:transposase
MQPRQLSPDIIAALATHSERLGPLPVVNHFIERLGLEALLDHFVPTDDRRVKLPYAKGLGVLLRSILIEREPIYRQQEFVGTFAPEVFGLTPEQSEHVGDDAIGSALDHLFDADRAALLTEVVVAMGRKFGVSFDELHNDSTSIKLTGQYRLAQGRLVRGQRAPFITYGHSKDHRPDLKQLLFVLTTTRDGGVPVQFRCEDGNQSDSRTHEETWDALRAATGRADFLYVADSKLCAHDPMDHIHRRGGRLVCVMPRSRREDAEFREWLQSNEPQWQLAYERPNPRRRGGPKDRWWTLRASLPSREGWPVVWVHSSLGALAQGEARRQRLARAQQDLGDLNKRLAGPRPRLRTKKDLVTRVEALLKRHRVARYLQVDYVHQAEHEFKQAGPGRPGPNTRYLRKTRKYWLLRWTLDQANIDYDQTSDGMYPLLTNDRTLTDLQVLDAHKRQPTIEKRFRQTKSVHELAPVFLKNEARVEALFFVYFLVLVVQALVERELRTAMQAHQIQNLPLYGEERAAAKPTSDQIFRLFILVQRQVLMLDERVLKCFNPDLTDLQRQVLNLLGVAEDRYFVM